MVSVALRQGFFLGVSRVFPWENKERALPLPELLARKLPQLLQKVTASMLALGLDVVVGNQEPLLCQTYFFAQQEHVRTEICPDAYKSSPEHVLVYLKLCMFLHLPLAYMTTSTSSSACKHAALPLFMLLYRNMRTGIADCMFRAEMMCLRVVH